jgi:putative transposase
MFRRCLLKWPFTLNALVLLPEHLSAIWSLPPGDAEYPNHWACSQRGSTMDFTDIEKRIDEPESLRKQGQRWLGSGESLTYATGIHCPIHRR